MGPGYTSPDFYLHEPLSSNCLLFRLSETRRETVPFSIRFVSKHQINSLLFYDKSLSVLGVCARELHFLYCKAIRGVYGVKTILRCIKENRTIETLNLT